MRQGDAILLKSEFPEGLSNSLAGSLIEGPWVPVAKREHSASNLSSQFEGFSKPFHVKHSTRPARLVSRSSSD